MECSNSPITAGLLLGDHDTKIGRNIWVWPSSYGSHGHRWSCANIDLDTWGRDTNRQVIKSPPSLGPIARLAAWTLGSVARTDILFASYLGNLYTPGDSQMLWKMSRISAESYGRATLIKLDFLGMSPEVSVTVFKVSFNLTLIPIDAGLYLDWLWHMTLWHMVKCFSVTGIPPPWLCNGQTLASTALSNNCAPECHRELNKHPQLGQQDTCSITCCQSECVRMEADGMIVSSLFRKWQECQSVLSSVCPPVQL